MSHHFQIRIVARTLRRCVGSQPDCTYFIEKREFQPPFFRGVNLGRSVKSEDALSEREAEVIKQVARGHTNQEIADRLGLSVKTVETYRARAMEKLGLANRAALVRYALEKGWLGD
jgi:DNA-binding NarL/FixJ family response regulator